MRQADALRLGHEPEERAVAVETPRPPRLDHLEARLVVAIEQLVCDSPGRVLVRQLDGVGAEPFQIDNRDEAVG